MKFFSLLPVLLLFIGINVNAQEQIKREAVLDDFPKGYTPREVGTKLADHFVPSKHFLHGGKWIHYAEVCTWLGALRYARAAGDTTMIGRLKDRFEPLFHEESAYLPVKNHVDLNMFGCLPLEFYQINGTMIWEFLMLTHNGRFLPMRSRRRKLMPGKDFHGKRGSGSTTCS